MSLPLDIEPGVVLLGRYRVERVVGRGGMGVVAAAWDAELRHHVAFKVLAGLDLSNAQAIERFMREARIAVRLKSEHVVRVMDAGRLSSGTPYMIMELLEGGDLSRQGALPPWTAVDYLLQAIEAIAEAHAQDVIHRDLKPANLFLASRAGAPPIVKVLDFGISKVAGGEGEASLTGEKAFFGSPRYMSPEQFRSPKLVDARTDVWALGATLHELLANEPVFGGTLPEIVDAVFHREPASVRARRQDVPEALEQVIRRCMQKNPDHRYANVAQLAQALAPFGSGEWQRCVDRASRLLPSHEGPAIAPPAHGTPSHHPSIASAPTQQSYAIPVAPSHVTAPPGHLPSAQRARIPMALLVALPISAVAILAIVLLVVFRDKWGKLLEPRASVASLAKVSMASSAEKIGEAVRIPPMNTQQMTIPLSSAPFDQVTFMWGDDRSHVNGFYFSNKDMRSPANVAEIRKKLRTLLGRRFDNDSTYRWQGCSISLSNDGAMVLASVNNHPKSPNKEPWQQQIQALWDVLRVAVLGLDVPITPNASRDWLGGGYSFSSLASIDVEADIERARSMIEGPYPGAMSYGSLHETIALDHPWFSEVTFIWDDSKGRLEYVKFAPPPEKEPSPKHADIDACLQTTLGPPKRRSAPDRVTGNYSTSWFVPGAGIHVEPQTFTMALTDEKPFYNNASWQKLIATLDACGKGN